VLSSDEERTALLEEAETCVDPDRLGDVPRTSAGD
jgi:ATP-binding cassette subfamily F protein 3